MSVVKIHILFLKITNQKLKSWQTSVVKIHHLFLEITNSKWKSGWGYINTMEKCIPIPLFKLKGISLFFRRAGGETKKYK